MPLERVISGGQTGVDQTALIVARELNWPTGGTAPRGYRTDTGPNLDLRDIYGLKESWSVQYAPRTIQNVRDAGMTVWFGDPTSAGGRVTLRAVRTEQERRPTYQFLLNPGAGLLSQFIEGWGIEILNVAGNRFSTHPEASIQCRVVLHDALYDLIPF